MTNTQQPGLAGRVLFYILGTALFLVIAILPYAMFMRFAADSTVRTTVPVATGVILFLFWIATVFGPLSTRRE